MPLNIDTRAGQESDASDVTEQLTKENRSYRKKLSVSRNKTLSRFCSDLTAVAVWRRSQTTEEQVRNPESGYNREEKEAKRQRKGQIKVTFCVDDKGNGLCPLTTTNNWDYSLFAAITAAVQPFDVFMCSFCGVNVVDGCVYALWESHMCGKIVCLKRDFWRRKNRFQRQTL